MTSKEMQMIDANGETLLPFLCRNTWRSLSQAVSKQTSKLVTGNWGEMDMKLIGLFFFLIFLIDYITAKLFLLYALESRMSLMK